MRDVSANFLGHGAVIERQDAQRLIDALAALHAAFWNRPPDGLCGLEDLVSVVSPNVIERLLPVGHPFRRFSPVLLATVDCARTVSGSQAPP